MKADINTNSKGDHQSLPFVSVVMPVRNENRFIKRSLEAVLKQDYPNDLMEVLIVDGMSTDNTRHTISHIKEKYNDSVVEVTAIDRNLPTLASGHIENQLKEN